MILTKYIPHAIDANPEHIDCNFKGMENSDEYKTYIDYQQNNNAANDFLSYAINYQTVD